MLALMSTAALQHSLVVLRQAAERKIELEQTITEIVAEVERRQPANLNRPKELDLDLGNCPYCSAPLTVWRGVSAEVRARVIGCKPCHYSRIATERS